MSIRKSKQQQKLPWDWWPWQLEIGDSLLHDFPELRLQSYQKLISPHKFIVSAIFLKHLSDLRSVWSGNIEVLIQRHVNKSCSVTRFSRPWISLKWLKFTNVTVFQKNSFKSLISAHELQKVKFYNIFLVREIFVIFLKTFF